MHRNAKRCYFVRLLLFVSLALHSCGLQLNDRYCRNGAKQIPHCRHSQSGLCKPTNESQQCDKNGFWNNKNNGSSDGASCSLDYVPAKECDSTEWPIFAYNAKQPPFRVLVYRHNTWMEPTALALNLSLVTDTSTGVKFFFQHQHDANRELCRKFNFVNTAGYMDEELDHHEDYDSFDGWLYKVKESDRAEQMKDGDEQKEEFSLEEYLGLSEVTDDKPADISNSDSLLRNSSMFNVTDASPHVSSNETMIGEVIRNGVSNHNGSGTDNNIQIHKETHSQTSRRSENKEGSLNLKDEQPSNHEKKESSKVSVRSNVVSEKEAELPAERSNSSRKVNVDPTNDSNDTKRSSKLHEEDSKNRNKRNWKESGGGNFQRGIRQVGESIMNSNSRSFANHKDHSNRRKRSANSVSKRPLSGRHKRTVEQQIVFWDCPMFDSGLEGEDYFLRLADDAGWGAHLSFTVPTIDKHDRFSTPVQEWWVFHYLYLEHVTLKSSIPVTLQSAPFPGLLYNVTLRHACCGQTPPKTTDGDNKRHSYDKNQRQNYDNGNGNGRIFDMNNNDKNHEKNHTDVNGNFKKNSDDDGNNKNTKKSDNDVNDKNLSENNNNERSNNIGDNNNDPIDVPEKPQQQDEHNSDVSSRVDKNGCSVCGDAIESRIVPGPSNIEPDTLLPAMLTYQSAVGSYAVTVQIISPECGLKGCYTAVSPVFTVSGGGYGGWVVVTVVVLLVLFLLSFTIMALIIRKQAEVASKKLWCRPRVLLVCCPHSLPSLSLVSSLTSFLHHTAAITATSIHTHLSDADPYHWMLYEMRTANKVLFLVPPRGKTTAKYSHVQQQWRLGVQCYAATHGALSNSDQDTIGGKQDRNKFALLMLQCSGLVPAQISHLQRFNLLDDLVSLVTWLHDGNVLDRFFLWRPLVTHPTDAAGITGTPYKRSRGKKSSIIWSGCRRNPAAANTGTGIRRTAGSSATGIAGTGTNTTPTGANCSSTAAHGNVGSDIDGTVGTGGGVLGGTAGCGNDCTNTNAGIVTCSSNVNDGAGATSGSLINTDDTRNKNVCGAINNTVTSSQHSTNITSQSSDATPLQNAADSSNDLSRYIGESTLKNLDDSTFENLNSTMKSELLDEMPSVICRGGTQNRIMASNNYRTEEELVGRNSSVETSQRRECYCASTQADRKCSKCVHENGSAGTKMSTDEKCEFCSADAGVNGHYCNGLQTDSAAQNFGLDITFDATDTNLSVSKCTHDSSVTCVDETGRGNSCTRNYNGNLESTKNSQSNVDVSNMIPEDVGRPEWADEILAGDRDHISNNVEERMNLPVAQNAFASTIVQLEEAVKLVELEEIQSQLEDQHVANNTIPVKPPKASGSWLQRLFFANKKKHAAAKPILDDVEEFSLYDNSIGSNATTTTTAFQQHSNCVGSQADPCGKLCSENKNSCLDANAHLSASFNTLCDISMINDKDDDVDFTNGDQFSENFETDEGCFDVVSPAGIDLSRMDPMSSLSFEAANFDPMPNVSELPLLGEDMVSPITETSSCQVEDDDDDFTTMLFGGTMSD